MTSNNNHPEIWMYPYPCRQLPIIPPTTPCTIVEARWKDLPVDILLAIFARLDTEDLIVGAPVCCKSWYKVSKNPILWKHVNLYDFGFYGYYRKKPVFPNELIEFAVTRSQGSLTSIKFPSTAHYGHLLHVLESCPRLEAMEFNVSFFGCVPVVEPIDQNVASFRKLILHGYFYEDTALVISTLFPRLRALDLYDCRIYDDADLENIRRACTELESLIAPKDANLFLLS